MRSKWIFLFWGTYVFALPQDPFVVSGDASMNLSSEVLEIVAQDGTTIEWRDFSISTSETTRFSQPSAEALVLNRVVGSEMSQIFGKLEANGRVLLINPNGVLFGKEARIDTSSFIASTLDLQNDLFAKNKIFKGESSAQIINLGSLNAHGGDLALIASDINNQGSLNAATVALIGSTYTQDFECQFPDENGSRITHSGKIDSPGGRIHLMSNEIYVFKDSTIATSSSLNGGEILIGGGLRGKDLGLTNAQMVWIDEGAKISADVLQPGSFGQVIIYSDGVTDFAGRISAKGGFVEVSGGYLNYTGFADLGWDENHGGTLLLDPTDITIAAANVNSSTTLGFPSFPFLCGGGSSLVSTLFETSVGFPASTISVATLLAQLTGGPPCASVVVDSTGGVGGLGNITWLAGNDLAYVSSCDLVLRAPATGTVTILSNVQNGGTGRVIIDSQGPLVNINTAANGQEVSFGSQNGLTQICALNATVNLTMAAIGRVGQVGFYALSGDVCDGPINVNCNILNLTSYSQIGHGQIDNGAALVTITTANATIDVTTSQNIIVNTFGAFAKIGHGSQVNMAGTDLDGDITVTCGRDLTLSTISGAAQIGHGAAFSMLTLPARTAGDIDVCVLRDLSISADNSFHKSGIGHGGPSHVIDVVDGSIDVCCGRNLTMTGTPGFERIHICHNAVGVTTPYTGSTLVTVGNDLTMTATAGACLSGSMVIGLAIATSAIVDHTTQIVCGQDLIANINRTTWFIGATPGTSSNTRCYIAASRDITLNTNQCSGAGIQCQADLAIAAGRNFSALNGPGLHLFVSSYNSYLAGIPNNTTRIYAGGNIIGVNGLNFPTILGAVGLLPNFNVDFRAGGDIQIPNSMATGSGSIFLEADTLLTPGQMWNYTAGSMTSICGLTLPFPMSCRAPCNGTLAGRATSIPSPSVTPNGVGCFGVVTAPLFAPPVFIGTTTGNITIHSTARSTSNFPCDLVIGPGGDLLIATTSGNIEVYGTAVTPCIRSAFRNITINQAIVTTGTVRIVADHDLTITSTGSIDTSGGNSPVELVCDNEFPIPFLLDSGHFVMQAGSFINTGTAPLHIYTVQPNLNTINGLLNGQAYPPPGGPANFFTDTCFEQWCTYYCAFIPTTCDLIPPTPPGGVPFTIAYKICMNIIVPPMNPGPGAIISQALVDLHPYNEYPGWMMRFWCDYKDRIEDDYLASPDPEPYMLRRRHLNVVNHPKTWTQQSEDTHPRPLAN